MNPSKTSEAPSLSVILLMYNEAPAIVATLIETLEFLNSCAVDFEILVVDDGSIDDGPRLARQFAAGHPDIRVISHQKNLGMGAGMTTGIANARMEYLVFNAVDGQIPACEIGRMLPLLKDADIVLSTWEDGRESLFRDALSRAFRIYLRLVARIDVKLEGLYLFPVGAAKRLSPGIEAHTFFFSFALIQQAKEEGLTVATTRIRCLARRAGKSKTLRISTIAGVAREVLRYRLKRKV